jgi:hypothetical protein
MKLKILSIAGHGDQQHERVHLSVEQKCDLQYYQVADTTYTTPNTISNRVRHVHWFKPREVDAGDQLLLYTGVGDDTKQKMANGRYLHVLYWNLHKPIWNDTGDAAVLFELSSWKTTRTK